MLLLAPQEARCTIIKHQCNLLLFRIFLGPSGHSTLGHVRPADGQGSSARIHVVFPSDSKKCDLRTYRQETQMFWMCFEWVTKRMFAQLLAIKSCTRACINLSYSCWNYILERYCLSRSSNLELSPATLNMFRKVPCLHLCLDFKTFNLKWGLYSCSLLQLSRSVNSPP